MIENSTFKFLGYKIPKIDMKIEDSFGISGNEKIVNDIKVGYSINPDEPRFVEVSMLIALNAESGNFKMNFEIKGGFLGEKEMSEDYFKNLYTKNAPAILYPYARSLVSNYMALANIPPYFLPLINLSKNEEAKEVKKNKSNKSKS